MQGMITPLEIRKIILEQSFRAHVGHIGSALSIADLLAVLYSSVLKVDSPSDPERDRFILSKGHAALALYASVYLRGFISYNELNSYCSDGTYFGTHPEHRVPGIDFCTGSLGLGLSYGVGAALAARLQNSSRRVFVLVSDAECNEGSTWEAVMLASHHHLSNLVAIVDLNGQQAFGYTNQVLNMSPMSARWSAFGWNVHEIDGNDPHEVERMINGLNYQTSPPHAIIAHTIFGKGVSFMENMLKWHYLPMSEDEYKSAVKNLK